MSLSKSNITIKVNHRVFDSFFKVNELIVDHDCFDGRRFEGVRREVIAKSDATSVLLYDPKRDEVLFVRQLRVPLLMRPERASPWTIEIVAGTIDRAETPEEIILAEANEEAGVFVQELIPIYEYYPSTGGSASKMHLYLGLCDLENAGGYFGLADELEDIEAFVVSREEGFQMLDRGELDNEFTIIAMLWFQLHYKEYLSCNK
ncbi:NUDIX domain-containing protein [Ignatzschineria sp. LJL83]